MRLSGPAADDTLVTATISDPTALSVQDVVIPAGRTEAAALGTVVRGGTDVTVTVSLGSVTKDARLTTGHWSGTPVVTGPPTSSPRARGTRPPAPSE